MNDVIALQARGMDYKNLNEGMMPSPFDLAIFWLNSSMSKPYPSVPFKSKLHCFHDRKYVLFAHLELMM